MADTSICSCGAEIGWAVTEKGKRIPIDRELSALGNVEVWKDGNVVRAKVHAQPIEDGRTAHFVACPDADKYRRR